MRQGGPSGEFAQLVVSPDLMDIRRHRNKNVSIVFCRFQFEEPHLQIRPAVVVYDELRVNALRSEKAGQEWRFISRFLETVGFARNGCLDPPKQETKQRTKTPKRGRNEFRSR